MTDRSALPPRKATPAAGSSSAADASLGLGGWAREYAADLHRFLTKRWIIESDIKDVCQEVYLRLLRFERTEVIQNPQAYLFRVAANVAHDFSLRQAQWTLTEPQLDEPTAEPGPEQLADIEYRKLRIASMLACTQRKCLSSGWVPTISASAECWMCPWTAPEKSRSC